MQFFFLVFVASFSYYTLPGYLFQALSTISFVCLIRNDSITAQQIGSGMNGIGIGSFGLDWNIVAAFLGSPLAVPGFAIINMLIGFMLDMYVLIPLAYWTNLYDAKKFPLISSQTFDSTGATYNVTRVLNPRTFDIDLDSYNNYSKIYLSITFAFEYGLSFAILTATISHVVLFHGEMILQTWRKTTRAPKEQLGDVHTRIMKRNYEQVPEWWFATILTLMVVVALVACECFGKQLQLPWWGILLSLTIALVFTLPIGVIVATTNIKTGLNVISELIIGFIYPGKPLANVVFKIYGHDSMVQVLGFLRDFKLGHYMKIPPKSMFIVQLVGTVVASTAYFATSWWLLTYIENICDEALLPKGSPWTCPGDDVFYNASIIWGVVGPARSVNYITWGIVGIFFNFYVYRKFKAWWVRHTYILSAALDAGVAFMSVILYFTLQSNGIFGPAWWGLDADHCPLAKCPTAPGVYAEGCPLL